MLSLSLKLNPLNRKMKLACLGDSITAKIQYSIPACKDHLHWTELVSLQLGVKVYNFGISGNTTTQQLARFQDVLNAHPTHCILEEACNDIIFGVYPETTMANQITMVQRCVDNGIIPIIMCSTPQFESAYWYANVNPNLTPIVWETYISQVRALQQEYCNAHGYKYIDVFTPLSINGAANNLNYNVSDRVHPNVLGYRIIAEQVVAVMKDLI